MNQYISLIPILVLIIFRLFLRLLANATIWKETSWLLRATILTEITFFFHIFIIPSKLFCIHVLTLSFSFGHLFLHTTLLRSLNGDFIDRKNLLGYHCTSLFVQHQLIHNPIIFGWSISLLARRYMKEILRIFLIIRLNETESFLCVPVFDSSFNYLIHLHKLIRFIFVVGYLL